MGKKGFTYFYIGRFPIFFMVDIDGNSLTIDDVVRVARYHEKVSLSSSAVKRVTACRDIVDKIIERKEDVYGINTGVGKLSNVHLSEEDIHRFQYSLIRSHAVSAGKPAKEEEVRAMILIRANQLATGYSGVRLGVIEKLIELLNKGVTPKVYESGSVGASGDLAQLAHVALVMTGEGEAYYQGKILDGKKALQCAGIQSLEFEAKEALAVINGPSFIAAVGSFILFEARDLIKEFEISAAMCIEALQGNFTAFDERVHKVKGLAGQILSASNIRALVERSQLVKRVYETNQDPFSLRSIPQVMGPVREVWEFAMKMVQTELNSASDNPLIFSEKPEVVSSANFQGVHLAFGLEILGIAITTLCVLSERIINCLLDASLSNGLPPFLASQVGKDSGFMQVQSLIADLLVRNKVLTNPAATQSVPVSANQEDFNSMGLASALKMREILENAALILAAVFMIAAQGLELRKPLKSGRGTEVAYRTIRERLPPLSEDRILYKDIELMGEVVKSKIILKEVEKVVRLS